MPRRRADRAAEAPPSEPVAVAPEPEEIPDPSEIDPEQLRRERLLVRYVQRRAERARKDPVAFFSFVMKAEAAKPEQDETGRLVVPTIEPTKKDAPRKRLVCMPHQRVVLSFVEMHPRCVLRLPAGASKTYLMGSDALRSLGQDPGERGAIVSATKAGAERPLSLVRDYIENKDGAFPELRHVYPYLRPSSRLGDPWRQDAIVVERPPGIRDPSLVAVGMDSGSLPGSRLSWILVDDLVNRENSRTVEQRKKVIGWFYSTVLSRDDVGTARIVVANTPWVDGGEVPDLTFVLERAGWPTLTMDVEGNVWVTNAREDWEPTFEGRDELRPAERRDGTVYSRLAAHDAPAYASEGARLCVANDNDGELRPANDNDLLAEVGRLRWFDLADEVPLWPEKWSRAWIEETRRKYAGRVHEFNQLYLCLCTDEDEAACKIEWIERCKDLGIKLGHRSLVESYDGPNLTVTGVDLSLGKRTRTSHRSALFTHEVMPDGRRRILDVDVGKYPGAQIVAKIEEKVRRYRSLVRVETNGGQDFLRQWAIERDASIPIRAHYTGERNKAHSLYGIQGVFIAFENGGWIVPVGETGIVHPFVQEFLNACAYFDPNVHTPDVLIAAWLACEMEREITRGIGRGQGSGQSLAAGVFSR